MVEELVRIGIVGGGISGASAAYLLHREAKRRALPLEVQLLERSPRLGGVIRTEHRDGYLLEWGPENFVPFKPKILELLHEVGLGGQLIGSNDERRRTYVYTARGLFPLPDGLAFLTPVDPIAFFKTRLLSGRGKLRAMLEPLVSRSRGELSVRGFLSRRLGEEFTNQVAEPLISAIYGGDIDRLSASGALASTHLLEQKYGSLWRGMRRAAPRGDGRGSMFYSIRNGMSELIRALEAELPPSAVHVGLGDLRLKRTPEGFHVAADQFESEFHNLVICTPAFAAADLLEPLVQEAAAGLGQIRYSNTSLLYLSYPRQRFSHPLDGFGFVAQRKAAQVLDACTWVSTKFEGRCPEDRVLLRCAVHDGRWKRASRPDEELADSVSRELKQLLGLHCDPDFWQVYHVRRGMPQPEMHHLDRLRSVEEHLEHVPGLYVTGGYTKGVGLPDCVASAATVVQQILQQWDTERD